MKMKCFVEGCKNKVFGESILKHLEYCKEHEKLADKTKITKEQKKILSALNGG